MKSRDEIRQDGAQIAALFDATDVRHRGYLMYRVALGLRESGQHFTGSLFERISTTYGVQAPEEGV